LALEGPPLIGVGDAGRQHLAALRATVLGLAGFLRTGPGLGDAGGQDEVLAEGVAFEALRQEQGVEAGVALERHSEHLVGLALVPGGARVHGDRRREDRGRVRDGRTDEEAAYRGQGHDVSRDAKARAGFVDGAQPVEVGAAEPVAGRFQGRDPGGRRYVDRQDLVRLLGRGVGAEEFLGGTGQPADGHRSSSPGAVGSTPGAAGVSVGEAGGFIRPLWSAAADGRGASDP
jgi:hypothetical protein